MTTKKHGGKRTPGRGKKLGRPLKGKKARVTVSVRVDCETESLIKRHAKLSRLSQGQVIDLAVRLFDKKVYQKLKPQLAASLLQYIDETHAEIFTD